MKGRGVVSWINLLSFCYFWHMKGQACHYVHHDTINEGMTFFCSQCSTWGANQQAEWRGWRSQCSTANDFTPQWHRQHPRQPSASHRHRCRSSLYCFCSFVFFWVLHSFDRWENDELHAGKSKKQNKERQNVATVQSRQSCFVSVAVVNLGSDAKCQLKLYH